MLMQRIRDYKTSAMNGNIIKRARKTFVDCMRWTAIRT